VGIFGGPNNRFLAFFKFSINGAAEGTAYCYIGWGNLRWGNLMKPNLIANLCLLTFFMSSAAAAASGSDTDSDSATDTDTDKPDMDSDTGVDADFTHDAPALLEDNPYPNGSVAPKAVKPNDEGPAWKDASEVNPPWIDVETDTDREPKNTGPVYLPPPPPPPSESEVSSEESAVESPCAKVTCSLRGACVMKNNEPTCACFAGFVPDRVNGLSCIAETVVVPIPPKRPASAWSFDAYYQDLETALGKFDTKAALARYRSAKEQNKWNGDFADYLTRSFKRTQNLGTVQLSLGIPMFAGGLSMHMLYAGYPYHKSLLAGAILLDITGLALIGAGAAMLTIGTKRIKLLEKFEEQLRRKQRWFSKPRAGLSISDDKAFLSFSLAF
jgi:hypothetical protein